MGNPWPVPSECVMSGFKSQTIWIGFGTIVFYHVRPSVRLPVRHAVILGARSSLWYAWKIWKLKVHSATEYGVWAVVYLPAKRHRFKPRMVSVFLSPEPVQGILFSALCPPTIWYNMFVCACTHTNQTYTCAEWGPLISSRHYTCTLFFNVIDIFV